MNSMNFAKGVGVGLVVGSAIGMAVISSDKSSKNHTNKKSPVGKALKTVGDIVENISDAMGM